MLPKELSLQLLSCFYNHSLIKDQIMVDLSILVVFIPTFFVFLFCLVIYAGSGSTLYMYALRVPEKGEQFAQEAYAFAIELLRDRVVEVKPQSSRGNRAMIFVQDQAEGVNKRCCGRDGPGFRKLIAKKPCSADDSTLFRLRLNMPSEGCGPKSRKIFPHGDG
ncbi:MAG: hypothetical protein R6U55_03030 [Desulfovermiculus sp.]